MNKDAFYFPHFSNARNDRKLRRVRKELQVEGYGIYFMVLEVLRDQDGFKYPLEDLDLLADEFDTTEQKLRAVVCNYQLFDIDQDNNIFSTKFNEYLEPYIKMKEQRRLAGKKSGEIRRLKAEQKRTTVEQPLNNRSVTVEQPLNENEQSKEKESKEKESKEKDNIDVRKLTFSKKVHNEFSERYNKTLLNDFIDYWTEHGDNDKKMKFEKEKSFGLSRRLRTWSDRSKQFNKPKQTNFDKFPIHKTTPSYDEIEDSL